MTRQIFRKAALNRLASPDQLDQLMQVTSLRSWVALIGFSLVVLAALLWSFFGTISTTVEGRGVLLRGKGVQPLPAPEEGVATKFLAKSGEEVKKGQPLVLLTTESGKSLLEVKSPFNGRMLHRVAKPDTVVRKGVSLVMLESLDSPLLAWLYIPISEGYQILPEMKVQVWPASVKKEEFGYLMGEVVSAARFPITRPELADRLQNEDMAAVLTEGGAKLQVIVKLLPDAKTASGFAWSTSDGPPGQLYSGTPCQARIITGRSRPIHFVFP